MNPSVNSLRWDAAACNHCGRCLEVCPHAVFARDGGTVRLDQPQACMECGACQRNCPAHAIRVDAGVGCASAFINGALRGKAPCCGGGEGGACCG